jgi:hypothetical protein
MTDQSCAKVLGRTDASIFVDKAAEEKRCTSDRVDGRGSHGCRDVGKGASGRVSRKIETMG